MIHELMAGKGLPAAIGRLGSREILWSGGCSRIHWRPPWLTHFAFIR